MGLEDKVKGGGLLGAKLTGLIPHHGTSLSKATHASDLKLFRLMDICPKWNLKC